MGAKILGAISWGSLLVALFLSSYDLYHSGQYSRYIRSIPPFGCVDLPGFKAIYASQDWGKIQCNRTITQKPLMVGGRLFRNGVGVHAHSWILLARETNSPKDFIFRGKLGVPDHLLHTPASIIGRILVNGESVWSSKTLRAGKLEEFLLPITNCETLELQVRDGGDGIHSDEGVWLEPDIISK